MDLLSEFNEIFLLKKYILSLTREDKRKNILKGGKEKKKEKEREKLKMMAIKIF